MDIPFWGRWILMAAAAVQLVYALRALRPALRSRPGEKADAWLAFADPAVGAPVSLALAFGNMTLVLAGLAVLGPILTWQLARTILSRRTRPGPA